MNLYRLAFRNIAGNAFRSWVVALCALLVASFALATTLIVRGAESSLRLGLYLDLQNGSDSGYLKFDAAFGFRYNLIGPRIPAHEFKETRVLYLHEAYREQLLQQRERRRARIGG